MHKSRDTIMDYYGVDYGGAMYREIMKELEHKINNFNEDLKWIRVGWRASPKAVSCSSISNEINAELIKKV